jgi:hypothetical protein
MKRKKILLPLLFVFAKTFSFLEMVIRYPIDITATTLESFVVFKKFFNSKRYVGIIKYILSKQS